MKLVAHFDGGCRTRKGIAAGAAVLYDEHGTELGVESMLLRNTTTPVAEYTGLHLALGLARAHAGTQAARTTLLVLGDAELIVRQVDGRYQCKQPHLTVMRDLALILMRHFAACEVREFPRAGPKNKRRHGNERADELCNQCMDAVDLVQPSTPRR